jgi:putative copper export protein
MSAYSTLVRATHLVTNAAWFGGSLMGAVALNPASREGDDAREQADIADEGWTQWGPVQGGAIGLHLLSGVAILADNRRRVVAHRPTSIAVVAKTALTGAALAASAAAYKVGADLGEAQARADRDPRAAKRARSLGRSMRWLQWATPATTAGILVLDAYLGEQQRGKAGLLDEPTRLLSRAA